MTSHNQSSTIFHSQKFEIGGILIPEFELKNGDLIRFYIPNFSPGNIPLGHGLAIELIKRFQTINKQFIWAKDFRQISLHRLLRPLTVKKFLINEKSIDLQTATCIADDIGISLNDKLERINITSKKALMVKAAFQKSALVLFDYYGIDASGIRFFEKLVNTEIEKGKSAIAFDRLEYVVHQEPYENIVPIKIRVPGTV